MKLESPLPAGYSLLLHLFHLARQFDELTDIRHLPYRSTHIITRCCCTQLIGTLWHIITQRPSHPASAVSPELPGVIERGFPRQVSSEGVGA